MSASALDDLHAQVELDAVRRFLGGAEAVPEQMAPRLEQAADAVLAASRPRGARLVVDIAERERQRVRTADGVELAGLGLAALLERSERVAAFAVSLGPGPEELMRRASDEGRLLDLTLLDAVASETVEALAAQAQAEIAAAAERAGRGSTRRYSPGYCDWALEQQDAFAHWSLLEATGIELTPDRLMIPEKSITAVMGIGPPGSVGRRLAKPPPCARCPYRDTCPGPNQV
jgi:hypothetical protein